MTAPQPYEPKLMRHPHARKGKITQIKGVDAVSGRAFTDSQGEPDVFPDVTVKDPTNEAYYRAQGYIVPGEVPPPPAEYAEYPVMLVHPGHVEAVPETFDVEKTGDGQIIRHRVPGFPEKFPPMQANDASEEAKLAKKGYGRPGQDNPEAIRRSKASPHVAGRVAKEFPKMVDGHVEDPDAQLGGPIQYPKWVGDQLVNSRAEEEALTGKTVDPVIDICIICDEIILGSEPRGEGKNGFYHMAHVEALKAPAAPAKVAAAPKKAAAKKRAKAKKEVQPPGMSRRAARQAATQAPKADTPSEA